MDGGLKDPACTDLFYTMKRTEKEKKKLWAHCKDY